MIDGLRPMYERYWVEGRKLRTTVSLDVEADNRLSLNIIGILPLLLSTIPMLNLVHMTTSIFYKV